MNEIGEVLLIDMESKKKMKEFVKKVADIQGWILNRDNETLNNLIEGLVENKILLGYKSCPCRLPCGNRDLDKDLICPCIYSQNDIREYRTCYCNLFMGADYYTIVKKPYLQIPERRPKEKEEAALEYLNQKGKNDEK